MARPLAFEGDKTQAFSDSPKAAAEQADNSTQSKPALPTERKKLEGLRRAQGRLPPGQSLTLKWPVLHAGEIPPFDPATWDLSVSGLVERPFKLDWDEFRQLPRVRVQTDFHCVTTWSKFDNVWEGVLFRTLVERAGPKPEAKFVMQHAAGGYATNTPLADLLRGDVLLADKHEPEPLTAEHGAPVRMVVPHLYAWKSAKWVRGFVFAAEDRAGYWEELGYHMYGDPFREERLRGC